MKVTKKIMKVIKNKKSLVSELEKDLGLNNLEKNQNRRN